jgi:glycosyltransferase involved in cell wall biosynthesis
MPDAVLIFNPGLHVLGGGERYTFDLASFFRRRGCEVVIAGPRLPSTQDLEGRGWAAGPEVVQLSSRDMTSFSRDFDLLINSTTSPPWRSRAKRSFLVVQFPFSPLTSWWNRQASGHAWSAAHVRLHQRRAFGGYRCIAYSRFAAEWTHRRWHVDCSVLQPAVRLGEFKPDFKRPVILGVGRLFPVRHRKRHDVLITAFGMLPPDVQDTWRLVLIGGVDRTAEGADEYMADLRRRANGLPITLMENADHDTLVDVSEKATLFWHAAGYGRELANPEQAEHFGISIVEAMSYGAVPMVYADGGPMETVTPATGVHWRDLDDLAAATTALIESPAERSRMARAASERSRAYGMAQFVQRAEEIFFG